MRPSLPQIAVPPLWRESRFAIEWAGLRRSGVLAGHGVPDGAGRGVLLIPGFMAGDGSLATMTHWLRTAGWHTKRAGIRANVDCSEVACTRLEERLERLADTTGDRVVVIGQSRGGVFAKALAARRPDLVSGVVGLGSPIRSMLAVHPLVLAQVGVVAALGGGRDAGHVLVALPARRLLRPVPAALEGPFPEDVGYVSLFSTLGRRGRLALLPRSRGPDCVEVHSSHCGMSVNAEVYRAVAHALYRFGTADAAGLARAA